MSRPRSRTSLAGSVQDLSKHIRGLLAETQYGANFSGLWTDPENPLPKSEKEVDAFIKKRIRIYLDSWVLPPLTRIEEKVLGNDRSTGKAS